MIGVIIQARMGSTRLPGKVLKKVVGKTLLAFLINRAREAQTTDKVIIATTNLKIDDQIERLAISNNLDFFRGSSDDVLDRYLKCAQKFKLKTIVRITGDCPLMDPVIIDNVVNFYKTGDFDYVTNGINSTFPDGMDVEVFSYKALAKAWENAILDSEREHVTAYIWKHREIFKIGIYKGKVDYSSLRLTVDEPEDFELVKRIVSGLYPKNRNFSLKDIVSYLSKNPHLLKINERIGRNEGYARSVANDKIRIEKIESRKIYLRELKPGGVTQKYASWLNDPQVNKYLETKKATIEGLRVYVKEKMKDPKVIFLGIFDKKNKGHIGNIKLEPVDFINKSAELGILIGDKSYWGRGYAIEAIDLLCDWAFEKLGLKYLTLGVYASHTSAIKAYEKAGFKIVSKKANGAGLVMRRNNKKFNEALQL